MKKDNDHYKDVEYEHIHDGLSKAKTHRQRRWHWSLASFATGCVTTTLFIAILYFTIRGLHRSKTAKELESGEWNHCGSSSREAMERGCVMDPPLYAWMPPKCYYHELTSSLPPIFDNRKYFSDMNMTRELRNEQLYNGEYARIYTMLYHDEHCLFQWRKLQYAVQNKMDYVDDITTSFKHSKHCADALTQGREPQTGLGQEVVLGFYRCHKTTFNY